MFAQLRPSSDELEEHYAGYPPNTCVSDLTRRRYKEVLETFQPYRQTGRILDIGCGDGHFLEAAAASGWAAYGSEYGDAPRQRAGARGIDVRPAPFPPSADELQSFDVITAIEVLEHVIDPRLELQSLAALVRPGGVLYVTTPNFNSLTRKLVGPSWRIIDYPEHLNLFTPRTLDRLLFTSGWNRIRLRTSGISPSEILEGLERARHSDVSGYEPSQIASSGTGPQRQSLDQRLREAVARSGTVDATLRALNAVLSALGAGDTIKALYRR